jgi:p38 MAP kinase
MARIMTIKLTGL